MKRIFIDGGTHLCEGLRKFIEIGVIDLNTEIHTFEPNPSCNVIERIKEFKNYNITYYLINADSFEGPIINDKRNGFGNYYSGIWRFTGIFSNGNINSNGKIYKNGKLYYSGPMLYNRPVLKI